MKLQQYDSGEGMELDMSPLIDMVFLLLIFFIVASQVIDEKPPVAIPTAAFGMVPPNTSGRLMISVTKDAKYFIRSEPTPRSIEEVQERIEMEIKADPDLRVLIRADAETKYSVNEKVTVACASVGAQDLIYSIFEE